MSNIEIIQSTIPVQTPEKHVISCLLNYSLIESLRSPETGSPYPMHCTELAVLRFNDRIKQNGPILGEAGSVLLGNSRTRRFEQIDIQRISHQAVKANEAEKGSIVIEMKLLKSMPAGKIIHTLLEGGVDLYASFRIKQNPEDFDIITVDLDTGGF